MILYCSMYLTAHYLYPLGAQPYCNNEPPPSLMTVKPSTSLHSILRKNKNKRETQNLSAHINCQVFRRRIAH